MGYFSKPDNQGDTLSGGSGSWVKRSVKKIFYAIIVTITFGVYKAKVSGEIIDIALKNNVSLIEAFQVAFIKALQKGTLDAPDMLIQGIIGFTQYPVTNIFRNLIPFILVYGVWFQITSIGVDILDGRRTDSVGFPGKALATAFVMVAIWGIYSGIAFLDPTPLTFNATEVAIREGWINGSVNETLNQTVNASEVS